MSPRHMLGGACSGVSLEPDWLADVWIVSDLDGFTDELRSLMTDRLDVATAAAVKVLRRSDAGSDEPIPVSASLIELAAASDPLLGSGYIGPDAALLLSYLVALVAGRMAGANPVVWNDTPMFSAELLGAGKPLLGLSVPDGSRCFTSLQVLPDDALHRLLAVHGWNVLTNLVALGQSVDAGAGRAGMVFCARRIETDTDR